MSVIRVLICDDDAEYRDYLRRGFDGHPRLRVAYMANSGRDAEKKAREGAPDAAIIDHGLMDMSGLEAAQEVAKASPGTVTFLLSDNPWAGLVQQSVALGIKSVMDKRMSPAEIAMEVERWVDSTREELRRRTQSLPDRAPGRGPHGDTVWVESEAHTIRQLVLVVTSGTKGGIGKTTVTVNMACAAAALARESGKIRVALVDLNESGNTLLQLNMGDDESLSPHSVLAWSYMPDNPTKEEVDEMLVLHRPSGLLVVPPVPSPERHDEVDPALIRKIISILRKHCSLVICDVPPTAKGAATWAAIEEADAAVVVIKPDVQDIRDFCSFYSLMKKLNSTSKLNGVMNLVGDPRFFDAASIESQINKLTGLPIIERLPFDPKVSHGVQRGQPYVLTNPEGDFTQGIKNVINSFTPLFVVRPDVKKRNGKSIFGFLKKVMGR